MTTKPKVRKFRIRRTEPKTAAPGAAHRASVAEETDDGFGSSPYAGSAAAERVQTGEIATPEEASADEELQKIRKEGLTGRQLRMARRVAQKYGIAAMSDYDAVRQLRRRGIDPFQRSTLLELVVPESEKSNEPSPGLPQAFEAKSSSTALTMSEEQRAQQIMAMQRDIVRRRQRRFGMLMLRLAIFVFVPTLIAYYYFSNVATPLYATKSELVIQQADSTGMSGGAAGLLSGTAFATATDSITVQSYLQSREAMLRLDADHGFKAHFAQQGIDPLLRLEADSTNEEAYRLYKRQVKIGYDPTEGVIRMEVSAADPETSVLFSSALISYAEEQVDQLTQRKREDQMAGAMQVYEDAQDKVLEAQAQVLRLQEQMGILDPVAESTLLMSQIGTYDAQLIEKRLQLDQLLSNARPNQARVDGVKGDIARLEAVIGNLRAQLTETTSDNESLARISGQVAMAEVELQSRQLLLQSALQQLETARIEANRQVRYLAMGVRPVAPDEPTYPRVFENTLLSFLVFGGIYLMASLTASILREQVTA